MKIGPVILTFFLTLGLSVLIDLICFPKDSDSTYLANLLLMTYAVLANLLVHAIQFALFYFPLFFLMKKIESKRDQLLATVLLALAYISVTIAVDWNVSMSRFQTFSEYLDSGSHYALFAFVVALIASLQLWVYSGMAFDKKDSDDEV